MTDASSLIFKPGLRKFEGGHWHLIPGTSMDSLSSEEHILEALRGRMESCAHLFESIALQKGTIGGEGTIHLQVRNGQLAKISRDVFTAALGIPREKMRRLQMISDDPAQRKHGVRITFPEKELREVLGIPAQAVSR